jgi:hypothetical protein
MPRRFTGETEVDLPSGGRVESLKVGERHRTAGRVAVAGASVTELELDLAGLSGILDLPAQAGRNLALSRRGGGTGGTGNEQEGKTGEKQAHLDILRYGSRCDASNGPAAPARQCSGKWRKGRIFKPFRGGISVRKRTDCPIMDIHSKARSAAAGWRRYGRRMDDKIIERIQRADWERTGAELDAQGWAILPALLGSEACAEAAAWWDEEAGFRSRVIMARHGFGRGEYRYFAYPLPDPVAVLRSALYPRLAPIANGWNEALGIGTRFPSSHDDFLARCHAAGQVKPTPLILRYGPGDFNALHQDLYGEHVFPIQAAILLSRPGADFDGGEFLLTEQRPRMQSRGTVVPLAQGDLLLFAVSQRPVRGSRGWYRTNMRHGISTIRSGDRRTLGLIFHDAA